MKFENEALSTSFVVPDRPSGRQRLQYRSAIIGTGKLGAYERYWEGVKVLVQEWESAHVENPMSFDMDSSSDQRAALVITWACNAVAGHMAEAEEIDPN